MIYNFLSEYLSIIIFLFIALFLSVGFVIANYLASPSNPDPEKLSAYECGFEPFDDSRMEFDCLYGPAYKGIFLGSIVATIFSQRGRSYPLSFNRKEIKDHGEGGNIIGADPIGNVLIVDDVLSAGTAARESIKILEDLNSTPKIFLVGLDRQEKGKGELSAKTELEKDFGIHVSSIINLDALIEYSHNNQSFHSYVVELEKYRSSWGA